MRNPKLLLILWWITSRKINLKIKCLQLWTHITILTASNLQIWIITTQTIWIPKTNPLTRSRLPINLERSQVRAEQQDFPLQLKIKPFLILEIGSRKKNRSRILISWVKWSKSNKVRIKRRKWESWKTKRETPHNQASSSCQLTTTSIKNLKNTIHSSKKNTSNKI